MVKRETHDARIVRPDPAGARDLIFCSRLDARKKRVIFRRFSSASPTVTPDMVDRRIRPRDQRDDDQDFAHVRDHAKHAS
ncbi:MAG: hypothetical protein NVS2B17_31050 [Candidatus Velthaea sp.]